MMPLTYRQPRHWSSWGLSGLAFSLALGLAPPGQAAEPARRTHHFSFAGKRPTFGQNLVKPEIVVSGEDSEGRLSLVDEIWDAKFQTTPHYHKRHAETFYIVSGQVEWTVGGKTQVMKAGDLVHIPAYTMHETRVVGGEDMHTLMIFEPGGFEANAWFRAGLTPEQLKDPKIQKQIELMGDVNRPGAGAPLATQPVEYFSVAGRRPSYRSNGVSEVALSSTTSGGRLNVQDEVWNAGTTVEPHFHKTRAETFYILEGRAEFTVGGETRVLARGDAVHIRPNTAHGMRALDGKSVRTLVIHDSHGHDDYLEARSLYTETELRDPAISKRLLNLSDFHTLAN